MFKSIVRSTMDVEKENTIKVLTEMNKYCPEEKQINIYKAAVYLDYAITDLTIQLNACMTYDSFVDSIKAEKKYTKEFQYVIDYLNRLEADVNLIKEMYK